MKVPLKDDSKGRNPLLEGGPMMAQGPSDKESGTNIISSVGYLEEEGNVLNQTQSAAAMAVQDRKNVDNSDVYWKVNNVAKEKME